MTTSPLTDPRPGDVIFVRSKGRDALGSSLLQRVVLNPSIGPLFSHVAVALTDRVAIEASTAADEGEPTWSGATLGEGVRLQLLPDLIMSAKAYSVLRHQSAPDLSSDLDVHTSYISHLLGSGYSTKALVDKARSGHRVLASLLPDDSFNWTGDPDHIARALRDDPELRTGIERYLRQGHALDSLNDYICSQLVALLLSRAGLLGQSLGLITPCDLYDKLIEARWKDVTDTAYGSATVEGWQRRSRDDWKLFFKEDTGFAKWFRDAAHAGPMIDLVGDTLREFADGLDAKRRELESRYGAANSRSSSDGVG